MFSKIKKNILVFFARKIVKNTKITIISQNCIGGVLYHDLKSEFLSPTINLYFNANDFIKFVNNLEYYLDKTIHVSMGENYPIGIIDDITIHFVHYTSCDEASELWSKRCKRVDYTKIFVISTDRDGFDDKTYEMWKRVEYPKILFTSKRKYEDDAVYFSEFEKYDFVQDIIGNRKFYKRYIICNKINKHFTNCLKK